MSTAPPIQGIAVQFIYMCQHQVSAYFRRQDGRPLNVYTMRGPYEPEVVTEELDLEADPQAHLQQSNLEEFRRRNSETDLRLMERALGHDVLRVQERLERRLIEQTPTADNSSHNIEDEPKEQSGGAKQS